MAQVVVREAAGELPYLASGAVGEQNFPALVEAEELLYLALEGVVVGLIQRLLVVPAMLDLMLLLGCPSLRAVEAAP